MLNLPLAPLALRYDCSFHSFFFFLAQFISPPVVHCTAPPLYTRNAHAPKAPHTQNSTTLTRAVVPSTPEVEKATTLTKPWARRSPSLEEEEEEEETQ